MYSSSEKKVLFGLASPTVVIRFSKALVYLIFFYYGLKFTDNKFLIGVAFGITAIAQAVLTLPFGFWSDKYGRKPMIALGLIFFIVGSFLAAYPMNSIYILILARLLQGAGAIYSCVLGFISDAIAKNKRNRTLSIFSILTGIVFSVGIVIGPTIAPLFISYSALFIISGILGIFALLYLILFVPEPMKETTTKFKSRGKGVGSDWKLFRDALTNKNLVILYLTTFLSTFILVAILFVLVPEMLENFIAKEYSGLLLIPIFGFGMVIMFYASKLADKGKIRLMVLAGFLLVGVGLILLNVFNLLIIIFGLLAFFTGMAILDPLLPSLTIQHAVKNSKGTASGFYNLFRYLGEGVGPIAAGLLLLILDIYSLLLISLIIIIVSVILFLNLKE
jgi:MFS family permease